MTRRTEPVAHLRFGRFVVNYMRREFDRNDAGSQLAYFELFNLLEDDVERMLRIFLKRTIWPDEYSDFIEQLDEIEVEDTDI